MSFRIVKRIVEEEPKIAIKHVVDDTPVEITVFSDLGDYTSRRFTKQEIRDVIKYLATLV